MIKVLDKTFAILEAVLGNSADGSRRVSELAELCGINTATCARILKELAAAGYIRQISRQEGYTAGPRAMSLANLVSYRPEIMNPARALAAKTAVEFSASVLYCERSGFERLILCHENRCSALNIRIVQAACRDLTDTATGLVLTAFASAADRAQIVEMYSGIPSDLAGEGDMESLCARIRKDGGYCHHAEHAGQAIAAFSVFRNGEFIGAFGSSVEWARASEKKQIRLWRDGIARAAAELTSKISFTETAG